MFIQIENEGPEITQTNYFDSPAAGQGYFYLSTNAGTFRLLVPDSRIPETREWLAAREVIISRGAWPEAGKDDALEILFEDDSDNPYALHLTSTQTDRLPLDSDVDRPGEEPRWKFSVWTRKGKVLELPCRYRRVGKVPFLKPAAFLESLC